MMRRNRYFFLIIWIVCLSSAYRLEAQSIQHQLGAYTDYMYVNGHPMQKVHEYKEVIYAIPGKSVELVLPAKTSVAPNAYLRWYNYDTDSIQSLSFSSNKVFYTNGIIASTNDQTVTYTYPSGRTDSIRIACDASAYKDYTGSYTSRYTKEPTLSYRAVYEIRNANEQAKLLKMRTDSSLFLENYSVVIPKVNQLLGAKEVQRVCLQYKKYYGYAKNSTTPVAGTLKLSESFASRIEDSRFITIEPESVMGDDVTLDVTLTVGKSPNDKTYNLARFKIHFTDELPMIEGTEPEYRSKKYLEDKYILLSKETFERTNKMDTAQATLDNNLRLEPMAWDVCSYGYVHKELRMYQSQFQNYVSQWNEYGLYKTANVEGISNGYTWYNGGKPVYDRYYYDSGKTRNGYFMYIDAAQTPGTVAKLYMDKMCSGTKLFVIADIASLTGSGAVSDPNLNLVFVGVDAEGHETELSRYTSGDIPVYTGNGETPWWQLFYHFTYVSNVDYEQFYVRVENNCTSTSGGDYAIDDIRVYRAKPSVQVNQVKLQCGEDQAMVEVRVEFEKLLEVLGVEEATGTAGSNMLLKYQFMTDLNKDGVLADSERLSDYNYHTQEEPFYGYGAIHFNTNYSQMVAVAEDDIDHTPIAYSKDGVSALTAYTKLITDPSDHSQHRFIVFRTPNNQSLQMNQPYYTSVANSKGEFGVGKCDIISEPFTIEPPYLITIGGESYVQQATGFCFGDEQTVTAVLRDRISQATILCDFDWLINVDFSVAESSSILTAMKDYRAAYPSKQPCEADNQLAPVDEANFFTQADYDILQPLIANGQLILSHRSINRIIRYGEQLAAFPILSTAQYVDGRGLDSPLSFCDEYIPLDLKGPNKNPTIDLGLIELDHPVAIRMGESQYEDLKAQSAIRTFSIPVRAYQDTDQSGRHDLKVATYRDSAGKTLEDRKLRLIETTDSSIQLNAVTEEGCPQIASIENINVLAGGADNLIQFSIKNQEVELKDGYIYKVEFKFNQDQLQADEDVPCNGVGTFYIKVVSEHLTWTGQEGDNWNNDQNWKRSTAAELKDPAYVDDSQAAGFVPLECSKALIPVAASIPWLYRAELDPIHAYPLDLTNTNYKEVSYQAANAPTPEIQYDLALYQKNSNEYACKGYEMNRCQEIHFEPSAQLKNGHLLKTERAWVELQLLKNRWYMLTSPIQGVVAGDMYVPTATGRQETKLFEPILYDASINNRFSPAVYQRSWDKSASMVIANPNSSNPANYDAFVSASWSMAYNQVDQAYQPGYGFSLRADQEGNEAPVLFRLPKQDEAYDYYQFSNTTTGGDRTPITRTNSGQLAALNAQGAYLVNLSNATADNDVFAIGNPFMASLDMKKFFDENPQLERKFWTLTDGGQVATTIDTDGNAFSTYQPMDGPDQAVASIQQVVPMQAFFVQSIGATQALFKPEMTYQMPNANQGLLAPATRSQLQLAVHRNDQFSSVLLVNDEKNVTKADAQVNVETIVDSNRKDCPILYTVDKNQALSIQHVGGKQVIPLGVYSEDDTDVVLTVQGVSDFGEEVSLYDAVKNERFPIDMDPCRFVIPGRNQGRYFLNIGKMEDTHQEKITIFSPDAGKLMVTTLANERLKRIQIFLPTGSLYQEMNAVEEVSCSFDLPTGDYVVRAQSETAVHCAKVRIP